jgi:phosphoenolpyruvate carboxylase
MSSLWNVDDQTARLDELTSHQVEVKEAPLRRDVRSLGRLLGEVLKEQGGDELYAAVEEFRVLMIEHRESINETVAQRGEGAVTKRNRATAPQGRTRLERAEEIVGRLRVEKRIR